MSISQLHRFALAALLATPALLAGSSRFTDFVKVQGDQLTEGGRPYRFISFNIPNLHYVEDNVAFTTEVPWRWPDAFEIKDALESVRQAGGTVVRTYVLSVVRPGDPAGKPCHVHAPGVLDEEGFRALDQVLKVANETGVRVIIPFVDNWVWWGGIAEYAGFSGKPKEAFWTDPKVIADFKKTIQLVINRTNTLTRVLYRDDKAILCWETGNELESPAPWTREIADYIKSLDSNHLVMDGFHTTELRPESLEIPSIDIVTTHHYPGTKKSFAQLVRENSQKAMGRKPYVVGEFGFVGTKEMVATMDAVVETRTAGALVWSLRPRNRDGGFYWHSEPAGGDKYKAFHWPGFPTGDDYDEAGFLKALQERAFAIRGLPVPPLQKPAPPRLLPISSPGAISWQGSVGAADYLVERAPRKGGPWKAVKEGIDETVVQYRPLFSDSQVSQGSWYYRVRARNAAGMSKASNVVGPVAVKAVTLVDEMADFSLVREHTGALEFKTRDTRKAKEDMHRLAGRQGSKVVYRSPGPIRAFRLYSFFAGPLSDFRFSVSADGNDYREVKAQRRGYGSGAGDYGYWQPVLFQGEATVETDRHLKIEWAGDAEVSRVEIDYVPGPAPGGSR